MNLIEQIKIRIPILDIPYILSILRSATVSAPTKVIILSAFAIPVLYNHLLLNWEPLYGIFDELIIYTATREIGYTLYEMRRSPLDIVTHTIENNRVLFAILGLFITAVATYSLLLINAHTVEIGFPISTVDTTGYNGLNLF